MNKVYIWCDGGCRNNHRRNHNIGGWGVVIFENGAFREYNGYDLDTTNNRMEVQACIEAFKNVRDTWSEVYVYSDSLYLVNGATTWYKNWIKKDWKNSKGRPVENKDLWEQLLWLKNRYEGGVIFTHIRGHNGDLLNERADELANDAMDKYNKTRNSRKKLIL